MRGVLGRMLVLAGMWLGVGGLLAGPAFAFTTVSGPFTAQATLAGSFPTCAEPFGTVGPFGGLDDGTAVFITDFCNATLYRFDESALTGGASAGAPAASNANGLDSAVALSHGAYYGVAQLASTIPSGLYAFDPTTLKLTTTAPLVAAASFGPGTPKGVTADPASTDLYLSSDSGIYRVQNASSTSPTVTQFASGNFDGLAFNGAGSVLYAAHNAGPLAGHVIGFARNGSSVLDVNVGGAPDGIAVAPVGQTVGGVDVSNNVFVNNNNGTVERIDTNSGNAVSVVAAGGTRGDFAFVDTHGGLDVSQDDSYVRLSPAFFGTVPTPATPPVVNTPANSSAPAITGVQVPGTSLACSTGTWSGAPGSFTYQWRRDGQPIAGATAVTYTIVDADRGHSLTCAVTAANVTGSTTAVSGAVFVPGPPACRITGRLSITPTHLTVGRKTTVKAIKLALRCDQNTSARVTGLIRGTHRGNLTTHATIVTIQLVHRNVTVPSNRMTFVTIKLAAHVVKALSGVQHAIAQLILQATSTQGTSTARTTLTLESSKKWPDPVHRSTCCESRWSGVGCRVVLGAAAVSRGVSPEGERSGVLGMAFEIGGVSPVLGP